MRYTLGLFSLAAILWLLLSGIYTPLLLALGAVSCVTVVVVCRRLNLVDKEGVPLALLPKLPGYTVWLAGEIAKSNWDVMRRIVTRGRAIAPTMVRITARQPSAIGQTIFANSITLTPGTVTVEMRDGQAEVHALAEVNANDLENGDMARRVRRLEDPGHRA